MTRAGYAMVVPLALGLLAAPTPGLSRTERANQLTFLLLALFRLPAITVIRHFRQNGFSGRYLSFAAFWAVAAAAHGVLVVVRLLNPSEQRPLVGLAALAVVATAVPTGPADFLAPARRVIDRSGDLGRWCLHRVEPAVPIPSPPR